MIGGYISLEFFLFLLDQDPKVTKIPVQLANGEQIDDVCLLSERVIITARIEDQWDIRLCEAAIFLNKENAEVMLGNSWSNWDPKLYLNQYRHGADLSTHAQ